MFKLLLAILLGKLIFFITRLFKVGGGSAAPGLYALKIEPDLISKLIKHIPQNIVITGTNGKTTTSRMLDHFVKSQGLKTVRNSTGSNLERGIASALIERSNLLGKIKEVDLGIWELDEAAFNNVVFQLKPQIIVFLNAFRDQLDRYGEVDSVVKKWLETLEKINWEAQIIVNDADSNTSILTKETKLHSYKFKIKKHFLMDERTVITTKDPKPVDFEAEIIKSSGLAGNKIKLYYLGKSINLELQIPGIYHIYDLLAAFSVYYLLNLPIDNLRETLKHFDPAFGRVEKLNIKDIESYIFLIKNPAGTTAVLETIFPELKKEDSLLLALNDNFADGTDISWIWDADFERLVNATSLNLRFGGDLKYPNFTEGTPINKNGNQLFITGTRAFDLALRLKYAGVDKKFLTVNPSLETSLEKALKETKGRLFVLPTYTALLEIQSLLTKLGAKKHYWKESR
jgi:lipid II isoglutaminyl synthase (glutamine-hydrolysing)